MLVFHEIAAEAKSRSLDSAATAPTPGAEKSVAALARDDNTCERRSADNWLPATVSHSGGATEYRLLSSSSSARANRSIQPSRGSESTGRCSRQMEKRNLMRLPCCAPIKAKGTRNSKISSSATSAPLVCALPFWAENLANLRRSCPLLRTHFCNVFPCASAIRR